MKPYRKRKIPKKEFLKLRAIAHNYHKFMWTKFKKRIKIKRLK